MARTLKDFNRNSINFKVNKVSDLLPSYFTSEYPTLITFLQKYYDYLDSDQTYSYDEAIKTLNIVRDIEQTDLTSLNLLLKEIGLNTATVNYFEDPRFIARILAFLYRKKGTVFSAEEFFRAFYNIEVEIEYPKNDVFVIGKSADDGTYTGSKIFEQDLSPKVIQNGELYQTFSILVKTSKSKSTWEDLYKKFVHPAGFYLGSQTSFISTLLDPDVNPMPAASVLDSDEQDALLGFGGAVLYETSTLTLDSSGSIFLSEATEIVRDSSDFVRVNPLDTLSNYNAAFTTLSALDNIYPTLRELITINSPTFDDSDSDGSNMGFDNTFELFSQVKYQYYDSV